MKNYEHEAQLLLERERNADIRNDLVFRLSAQGINISKKLVDRTLEAFVGRDLSDDEIDSLADRTHELYLQQLQEEMQRNQNGFDKAVAISVRQGKPGLGMKLALLSGHYELALDQLMQAGYAHAKSTDHTTLAQSFALIASEITERQADYKRASIFAEIAGFEKRANLLKLLSQINEQSYNGIGGERNP